MSCVQGKLSFSTTLAMLLGQWKPHTMHKQIAENRATMLRRYMTDEHFWHVYFTIVKKYLPDTAYHWSEQDVLPSWAGPCDLDEILVDMVNLHSIN